MGDSVEASSYYAQVGFDARFEWGIEGMQRLAPHSDVVVIVDVLRFTTAVDVAVSRSAVVYPYHGQPDGSAEAYARELGARLADWRGATTSERHYSLSPASLLTLAPDERLVLPSPNGATLAFLAAATPATVLAGCLRNATAVAAAARDHGGLVAVIAAGERRERDTGGLRPAVEDLLGAGAILTALRPVAPSPEARAAMAAFQAAELDLRTHLFGCSSGRELVQKGFSQDVEIAAEHDVSRTVPILRERAFRALR
ncbi:MAG TPA: 2-phosphosulfolactate phosphatase [Ktedonobacterales bacterium]|nr:2-phosphosulfolactate phosphatase [Ktedonobacterales bacterium]